jgi:predicted  nucleic acid-binding Zn ribbon protein
VELIGGVPGNKLDLFLTHFMFKQKISISINSNYDREELFEEFEILMGNFCKTGQIIGDYETPFVVENDLIAYQTSLEKTSLSKKHYDEYTTQRIKKIEDWCHSKIITEVVGKAVPSYKGVCNCRRPAFYILFTHILNNSSPIDCGTCGKIVPLYKVPNLNYGDRTDILRWESDYKSCDSLQLNCTVGERWATKQMSDQKSQLSKQGISVCNKISKLTGVPSYYYLFNYKRISSQKDESRKCPSCNGKWLLREPLLNFYNFKCDKCWLLSTFSPITN